MATGIPHEWMGSKRLLVAILEATGGYRWLLASHMDGWGLRGYWRLQVDTIWLKPVFTAEYMASLLLPTLRLLVVAGGGYPFSSVFFSCSCFFCDVEGGIHYWILKKLAIRSSYIYFARL